MATTPTEAFALKHTSFIKSHSRHSESTLENVVSAVTASDDLSKPFQKSPKTLSQVGHWLHLWQAQYNLTDCVTMCVVVNRGPCAWVTGCVSCHLSLFRSDLPPVLSYYIATLGIHRSSSEGSHCLPCGLYHGESGLSLWHEKWPLSGLLALGTPSSSYKAAEELLRLALNRDWSRLRLRRTVEVSLWRTETVGTIEGNGFKDTRERLWKAKSWKYYKP